MYGTLVPKESQDSGNNVVEAAESNSSEKRRLNVFGRSFRLAAFVVAVCFALVFAFDAMHTSTSPYSRTTVLSTTSSSTSSVKYSSMDDDELQKLFDKFIEDYGREYETDSDEYDERFEIFKANLYVADDRNTQEALAGGQAIHGVTKFSDYTEEEFKENFLMEYYWTQNENDERRLREIQERSHSSRSLKIVKHSNVAGPGTDDDKESSSSSKSSKSSSRSSTRKSSTSSSTSSTSTTNNQLDVSSTTSSSSSVDWSESITTKVNDQGIGCRGASWAFAAAEQIESDAIRKGVLTISDALSAQELISCVTNSTGCTAGALESAYAFVKKPGAIHSAADYPYEASDEGLCTSTSSGYATTLGSYATVTKYHNEIEGYTTIQVEKNMLAHLVSTGTLSACLDATTWMTYTSGIMSNCQGSDINYCVQVVGVTYNPETDSGEYKIRASFGSDFGESGYVYLAYGKNTCDVTFNPGYTDPVTCC